MPLARNSLIYRGVCFKSTAYELKIVFLRDGLWSWSLRNSHRWYKLPSAYLQMKSVNKNLFFIVAYIQLKQVDQPNIVVLIMQHVQSVHERFAEKCACGEWSPMVSHIQTPPSHLIPILYILVIRQTILIHIQYSQHACLLLRFPSTIHMGLLIFVWWQSRSVPFYTWQASGIGCAR